MQAPRAPWSRLSAPSRAGSEKRQVELKLFREGYGSAAALTRGFAHLRRSLLELPITGSQSPYAAGAAKYEGASAIADKKLYISIACATFLWLWRITFSVAGTVESKRQMNELFSLGSR